MAKRISSRKIKINRSYDISEAAEACNVTPQTIRAWIKSGLLVLNSQRPSIILGFILKNFVDGLSKKGKSPLELEEFNCFRCKAPRKPFGMLADYVPLSEQTGRLMALCSVCESACNRFVKAADLDDFSKVLEIVVRPPKQD
jgi:hypothetical protein|tara:strand:- start:2978 stop:3403 length:426 start_codon:yes stop_codon:yes gene_type:complete